MLTTTEGTYRNGHIELKESPVEVQNETPVVVNGVNKMATTLKFNRKPRRKTGRPSQKMSLATKSEADSERPIWETVVELGAQISDQEWAKVPDDSSINYKRQLYGSPTKPA